MVVSNMLCYFHPTLQYDPICVICTVSNGLKPPHSYDIRAYELVGGFNPFEITQISGCKLFSPIV